jgi:hypothetical protein
LNSALFYIDFYGGKFMDIFIQALSVVQAILFLIGAALGIWGIVNLLEGYGSDNPGAKSQGIKHNMAK